MSCISKSVLESAFAELWTPPLTNALATQFSNSYSLASFPCIKEISPAAQALLYCTPLLDLYNITSAIFVNYSKDEYPGFKATLLACENWFPGHPSPPSCTPLCSQIYNVLFGHMTGYIPHAPNCTQMTLTEAQERFTSLVALYNILKP